MDQNCKAEHINRIETRQKDNPKLHPDNLTPEQSNQTDDFIENFKAESTRLDKLAEDALEKWKPI